MTDSVADSVGLTEEAKIVDEDVLCAVLEAVRVAMHCDDGWFTIIEAEC